MNPMRFLQTPPIFDVQAFKKGDCDPPPSGVNTRQVGHGIPYQNKV
jgi:hypothetical protein